MRLMTQLFTVGLLLCTLFVSAQTPKASKPVAGSVIAFTVPARLEQYST